MDLNNFHIETIKRILSEVCIDGKTVSRPKIYSIFENECKSGMERYRFEKSLSELIKSGKIQGFKVKVGRTGGVQKIEPQEIIEVRCSSGKYIGTVSATQLYEILSQIS